MTNERSTIPTKVTVYDISEEEERYNLDKCGFQLVRHQTKSSCVEDEYRDLSKIKSEYFPECEQLLKNVTGAVRSFIFDHKVRRGPSNWHKLGPNNSSSRGPLHRVHVDQSYRGAEFLVRRYLPDEADELLKKRWQIINVSDTCPGSTFYRSRHTDTPIRFRHGVLLKVSTRTLLLLLTQIPSQSQTLLQPESSILTTSVKHGPSSRIQNINGISKVNRVPMR